MRANAAAERIAAFATAYNSGQGMPQPVQTPRHEQLKPVQPPVQQAAQGQPSLEPIQVQQAAQGQPSPEPVQMATQTAPTPVQTAQPPEQQTVQEQAQVQPSADAITAVTVTVNGEKLTLTGKKDYIYVDVFDHIDFDLSKPKGKTVETLINGRKAQYVEPLKTGDVLDIFWKD